jgi:phage shock protein A
MHTVCHGIQQHHVLIHCMTSCVLQALQDKVQQLEAACAEARQLHASQAAAHESAARELRSQVELQRSEVTRVRMEAASLTKQYQQALQRLRREADAGAALQTSHTGQAY